ncbi:MAG: nickel pincer cofactor biosynthesis protein LarC [Synergistaceae bacterium]|jgi:uncharacterized protein (TIGR00299 family) protein|nr:nickel pincer cofactor biosynthesis protein LarC [Synergistaceae bacterium]
MKALYLDCFAGISGDMLVGALFELVPDADRFKAALAGMTKLSPDDYEVHFEKGVKNGIAGTHFRVHTHEHHPHRGLRDIEEIVTASALSPRIQREVLRAFALLAEAEAKVHGTTPDKIHFHEVGAIDSILDIVGTYVLFDRLGWPRVFCSPINVGSGTVTCAHGVLPVPAPAAEILLHGLPVYSRGEPMERTTPTGALLARCLAGGFSSDFSFGSSFIPEGTIEASGCGLGTRESSDLPNVLRVLLMDLTGAAGVTGAAGANGPARGGFERDRVTLLESNIDDMNPQDFELAAERLFEDGALDVWTEPIAMKKGRPGVKFCCLCVPEKADALSSLVLRFTTTQGVRRSVFDRVKLCYKISEAKTSLGTLRVKTAFLNGPGTDSGGENVLPEERALRRTPEYDDLKRLAKEHGLSMPETRARILRELGEPR